VPGLDVNQIFPLWSSTIFLQCDNPIPEPWYSFLVCRRRNIANILSLNFSSMPIPLSSKANSQNPFLFFAEILICGAVPFFLNLMAFMLISWNNCLISVANPLITGNASYTIWARDSLIAESRSDKTSTKTELQQTILISF